MKVRCKARTGRGLPRELLNPNKGINIDTEFSLTVGKLYTVYGLSVHDGFVCYLVCDYEYGDYPIGEFCPLFDIVDARPSKYWVFDFSEVLSEYDKKFLEYKQMFAFPEFHQEGFYERLLDGSPEEVAIFEKYRNLMDDEFHDGD